MNAWPKLRRPLALLALPLCLAVFAPDAASQELVVGLGKHGKHGSIGIQFGYPRHHAPIRVHQPRYEQPRAWIPGHYEQAVRNGKVVEPAQYEGARSQAQSAADIVADAAPDLEIIAPTQLEAAQGEIERLQQLIEQKAPLGEVGTASNAARQALAEAAGDESAQLSE